MAPIVAQFEADFTKFNAAMLEATQTIDTFAKNATDAGKELDKVSGKAPAAMRDTAAATSDANREIGYLNKSVGQLASIVAGAFTVNAILQFASDIVATVDKIDTLATRTGLTVQQVQELDHVAGKSGTTIETLSGALQTLEVRLGKGDEGAVGAIRELGINLDRFNDLDTEGKLLAISDAVRQIADPTKQSRIEAELFGGAWKELAPAIESDMRTIAKSATTMADENVKAINRSKEAWKDFKEGAQAYAGDALGWLARFNEYRVRFAQEIERIQAGNPASQLQEWIKSLSDLPPVDRVLLPMADGFHRIALSEQEVADQIRQSNAELEDSIRLNKEREEAAKASLAYWEGVGKLLDKITGKEATGAAQQWADALAGLSGSLTTLSQTDLAAADKAFSAALEAMARNGDGATELADQYRYLQAEVQAAIKQITDVGPQLDQQRIDDEKAAAEAAEAERQYTQALYDAAVAEDNAAIAAQRAKDELAKKTEETKKAEAAARSLATFTMNSAYSTGDLGALAEQMGGQVALDSYGNKYVWVPGKNAAPPGRRAAGGPVSAGAPYVVGEQGPELFVPSSNGSIVPNGAGVTVQNTFHIVDTEANIARRVSASILRSITQARRVS